MILVSDHFVHRIRRSSINSQRLRPLLAFAAFKAAGDRVLLFDVFPFVEKDSPHRRRCRNTMISMRFGRRVPIDERVPSLRTESLVGRFWIGAVSIERLPPFRASLYRVRDEYWVNLEYGGGITCRGSCRPPLMAHCMIRRADMKVQPPYY